MSAGGVPHACILSKTADWHDVVSPPDFGDDAGIFKAKSDY